MTMTPKSKELFNTLRKPVFSLIHEGIRVSDIRVEEELYWRLWDMFAGKCGGMISLGLTDDFLTDYLLKEK